MPADEPSGRCGRGESDKALSTHEAAANGAVRTCHPFAGTPPGLYWRHFEAVLSAAQIAWTEASVVSTIPFGIQPRAHIQSPADLNVRHVEVAASQFPPPKIWSTFVTLLHVLSEGTAPLMQVRGCADDAVIAPTTVRSNMFAETGIFRDISAKAAALLGRPEHRLHSICPSL
jgi:hypothetical protein